MTKRREQHGLRLYPPYFLSTTYRAAASEIHEPLTCCNASMRRRRCGEIFSANVFCAGEIDRPGSNTASYPLLTWLMSL